MSTVRVLKGLGKLSALSQEELNGQVAEIQPTPFEVAPTFHRVYGSSKRQALRLAEAYATSLPDLDQHRQLFQAIAPKPEAERRALVSGYRKAGQDRWIVAAIGELPAAQGRTLMKDFVLTES